MQDKKEYIIRARENFNINLTELWQYRELFYFFSWRDIKVKYKQTVLGMAWAILQPVAMMSVFVLFFSKGLNLSTQTLPPALFYWSALLYWNLFQSGLSHSAESMISNANIIKKIYFPRLIIPASSILVAFFDFLVAIFVFLCVVVYYDLTGQLPALHYGRLLFFLLLALFVTIVTTFGIGLFLAALNVKYRDFRYIIPFFLQFLFFATPIVYSIDAFAAFTNLKYILAINPISSAIVLARSGLSNEVIEYPILYISGATMALFFILGIYQFRRTEDYFADLA
jgi:lipopolysaccharide transport system permease protein